MSFTKERDYSCKRDVQPSMHEQRVTIPTAEECRHRHARGVRPLLPKMSVATSMQEESALISAKNITYATTKEAEYLLCMLFSALNGNLR